MFAEVRYEIATLTCAARKGGMKDLYLASLMALTPAYTFIDVYVLINNIFDNSIGIVEIVLEL